MKSNRSREGQLSLIMTINLHNELERQNLCNIDVIAVFLWPESSLYINGFENLKLLVICKQEEHSHGSPATKDEIDDILFQK